MHSAFWNEKKQPTFKEGAKKTHIFCKTEEKKTSEQNWDRSEIRSNVSDK